MHGSFLLHAQSPAKLIKLVTGTYFLGRSLECDFVVVDETISRRHAEISVTEGSVRVRDLQSRNGTYIDGKRVNEASVDPGQELRFGKVTFVLTVPGEKEDKLRSEEETASGVSEAKDMQEVESFSPAEHRVLAHLLNGLPEKEIARNLHLSLHTVHNHVRSIYRALKVHSRAALLACFIGKNGDTRTS